jgi:AraC-like DNA-binding protein
VHSIAVIQGNSRGMGLPKTAMSLVFNLGDEFKLYDDHTCTTFTWYKRYWLAGLQMQPSRVETIGNSRMVVVQFNPLGACVFVNDPLHYYTNNYVPLDAVFGSSIDSTWQQLVECTTQTEIVLLVENFLYRMLLHNRNPSVELLSYTREVLQRNSNVSIQQVCNHLGVSRKHLNQLSKEYYGVSPKTLATLHRFQATSRVQSGGQPFDARRTTFYTPLIRRINASQDIVGFIGFGICHWHIFDCGNSRAQLTTKQRCRIVLGVVWMDLGVGILRSNHSIGKQEHEHYSSTHCGGCANCISNVEFYRNTSSCVVCDCNAHCVGTKHILRIYHGGAQK